MEGYRLAELWRVVLDGQIPECNVGCLHLDGIGAEGTHVVNVGVVIKRYDCAFRAFTDELDVFKPRGYYNFLFICAVLDVYGDGVVHECTDAFKGFSDRGIVAGTVLGYIDVVFPFVSRGR